MQFLHNAYKCVDAVADARLKEKMLTGIHLERQHHASTHPLTRCQSNNECTRGTYIFLQFAERESRPPSAGQSSTDASRNHQHCGFHGTPDLLGRTANMVQRT